MLLFLSFLARDKVVIAKHLLGDVLVVAIAVYQKIGTVSIRHLV